MNTDNAFGEGESDDDSDDAETAALMLQVTIINREVFKLKSRTCSSESNNK